MSKPSIIQPASKSQHVFMGLHGDSGIGKSRFVGTSPGKLLIIRPATSHLNSLNPEDFARAEQAKVGDWDDMAELETHLRSPDGDAYEWVWVDELSALFHTLLDDVWDDAVKRKPDRKEFDLDKGEFGINMNRLTRWLRHIVGADQFHFGYTAWSVVGPSPDQDEDGDPIEKLMPWVQGKGMPNMCAGYMNVVAYYHKAKIGKEDDVRVLRTESSPRYYAKDQWDAFGGRVVNPTMPKVMAKIEASPKYSGATTGSKKQSTKKPAAKRRVIRR